MVHVASSLLLLGAAGLSAAVALPSTSAHHPKPSQSQAASYNGTDLVKVNIGAAPLVNVQVGDTFDSLCAMADMALRRSWHGTPECRPEAAGTRTQMRSGVARYPSLENKRMPAVEENGSERLVDGDRTEEQKSKM